MGDVETYARGYAVYDDFELHIGLEVRDGEDWDAFSDELHELACSALRVAGKRTHAAPVKAAEIEIADRWPGRAYFIETDRHNRGVQVYQPYGRPRIR